MDLYRYLFIKYTGVPLGLGHALVVVDVRVWTSKCVK